jgi:hypothetical protein
MVFLETSKNHQKCEKTAQPKQKNQTGNMSRPTYSIGSLGLCGGVQKRRFKRRKGAPNLDGPPS